MLITSLRYVDRATIAVLLGLSLQGCGGGGTGEDGTASMSASNSATMVRLLAEPAGINCATGGSQVLAGLDANGNGVLDAGEVATAQYVCSNGSGAGSVRSTLVSLTAEPAGSNCAAAGTKISAGLDLNANGLLDVGEVTSATYVCGGAPGSAGVNGITGANGTNGLNALMAMAAEAAGGNCTWGGNRVTFGLDANRNGVLDTGEITSTNYLCNGAPGPGLSWHESTDPTVQTQGNAGYIAEGSARIAFTLPAAPGVGDVIRIVGGGTGGWKLVQQPGQSIITNSIASTVPGAVWTARASAKNWRAIASSSDGNRLVAVEDNGFIYTSPDRGITWASRASQRQWSAVASSADGMKLAAVTFGDQIFVSDDGGVTWNARDYPHAWSGIAMSSDGTRIVATEYTGSIYISSDGGLSWTAGGIFAQWASVASSADGMTLAATDYGGQIHVSHDAGMNWTARESNRNWFPISVSADGARLVAAEQAGLIYVSTDGGVNWTPHGPAGGIWMSLATSADGQRLVASAYTGSLYVSNDGGSSWTARDTGRDWIGVAISSDGSRIAAGDFGSGFIYTSTASTSLGTAGSISGGQDDSIEVQYLGNGRFLADSHVGILTVE